MAEQAPKFSRNQTVWLRESAAMGFLEVVTILSIHYTPDGQIYYQPCQSGRGPGVSTTVGDRFRHRQLPVIMLTESDLVTYSEAVQLVQSSLSAQLANINSLASGTG